MDKNALQKALKKADEHAMHTMGEYWVLATVFNPIERKALEENGWKKKVLMSTWLKAPIEWKPNTIF